MFVKYDPAKHKGKQLYAPKGQEDSDGMIEEIMTPIEGIDHDLAAQFAYKFWVWEGEGEPPIQEAA
jgi:hypothetical protein